jgi:hypothetical protein
MEPSGQVSSAHLRHAVGRRRVLTWGIWASFAATVVAALAAVLFVISEGWLFLSTRAPHPTDAVLIGRFERSRPAFEELRQLFEVDAALWRLTPDTEYGFPAQPGAFPVPLALIGPERRGRYRRLLAELELIQIDGDAARDQITLPASSRGLMIGGSSKGYTYLRRPPGQVIADLSGYAPQRGERAGTGFRPLGGGWYLFVDVYR